MTKLKLDPARFTAVDAFDLELLLGGARSTEYISLVTLVDLEKEALKLPIGERARLAEILLESLDTLSEEEHQRLWTEEAVQRDAELDADPSMGRSAEEVFRDAYARLR